MPPEDEQERNVPGKRIELKGCEYGVPDGRGDFEDCGEPAIATWDWGNGPIRVCDEHDKEIEKREDEAREQNQSA